MHRPTKEKAPGAPLSDGNSGLSILSLSKTEENLKFSFLKETSTKRKQSSIDAR